MQKNAICAGWLPTIVVGLLMASGTSRACTVPVFRYALERWPADPYELMVFNQEPLGEADKRIVEALRQVPKGQGALPNVFLTVADVNRLNKGQGIVWKGQGAVKTPWVVLRYPETPPDAPPAWAGPLTAVRTILDSPARRQIASRLLAGETVVWVLIESGDKAKDDAAEALLREQTAHLQKTLKLPNVDPNDPDVTGPALRSELPLRLVFSTLRVSRKDPAEAAFVSMLVNGGREVPAADVPVVVPVFGRGRALCLLFGPELNADSMEQAAVFLVGECSCQVKQLNPGVDLLIAADWDAVLAGEAPREPQLPALLANVAEPSSRPATQPSSRGGILGVASFLAAGVTSALVICVIAVWGVLRRGTKEA